MLAHVGPVWACSKIADDQGCSSQAEPIIQLCHFKEYVGEIMKKHIEMLGKRKQSLRESLVTIVSRLFNVDFPTPYLEAGFGTAGALKRWKLCHTFGTVAFRKPSLHLAVDLCSL